MPAPVSAPPVFLFDVDSTLITVEALDLLYEMHGGDVAEFQAVTNAGMEGTLDSAESLRIRLSMFPNGGPDPDTLPALVQKLVQNISPSIARNPETFAKIAPRVCLISGGFHEWIDPLAEHLGISTSRVWAHRFIPVKTVSQGPRRLRLALNTPMARGGKREAVRSGMHSGAIPSDGPRWIIGDGATDLELRTSGMAHRFVGWAETVSRQAVLRHADHVVHSFDHLLDLAQNPGLEPSTSL
jgi:D-3-phosphoglycerate dehydrogenase